MDDAAKAINQFSTLMEDQNAKLDAVLELLGDVPKTSDFRRLEGSVDELRADVKVIKKVVGDHSRELAQLESRVSTVEAA